MAADCPGGHRRGELTGGGLTASTSYYTEEFAQKAVRAMIEEAAPDYHEFLMGPVGARGVRGAGHGRRSGDGLFEGGPELQGVPADHAMVHVRARGVGPQLEGVHAERTLKEGG